MKQKKLSARILSLVLTAAMALTMLPATSIKAEAVEGRATIVKRTTPLDLRATSLSYVDTEGATKTANPTTTSIVDTGEGWAWNNTTKTLTLDGVNIDCTGNAQTGVAFGIQLAIDHDIVLAENSTNTVMAGASTNNVENDGSYGVYFSGTKGTDASPSISGKGTLNATGGVSGVESAGILCEAATLKFSEATINASSSLASTDMGTGISGMINIESGNITATGTATGDGSSGFGIQTEKMTMSGGNVTATGTATTHGYGISGYGSFSMTGGKLSASGATAAIAIDDVKAETSTDTINAEGATVTDATETFVSGTTKTLTQKVSGTPVVISFAPKVTFDTRNGVDIPDEVITGGKITMPTNPVWGNYRFDGWYTDLDGADTEFANSGLTDSITVYAKWIAKNGKNVCTAPLDFTVANKDIDRSATEGWAWDNANKTLTLSGATIDCTGNDAVAGIVCAIQLLTDHDIVLETGSTNIVKAGASTNSISRGIYFEDLEESATIPSIGGSGTLKVTGGAAYGDSSGSFGIVCDVTEKFAFIDDATVIASSSAEAQLGAGIAGLIEIQSGKITANGTGIIHGYGIQSTGMTMSGGNVTATGTATATDTTSTHGYGISGYGSFSMTGGKLSASGATAAIEIYDVHAETSTYTINAEGATVTGESENFVSGTTKTLTQANAATPVVISFAPKVTFDTRNGVDIPDEVISEGGTITMPTNPLWGNYRFDGWYTDLDGVGTEFVNEGLSNSITVYAKWIATNRKTVCTAPLDFTVANKDIDRSATEGWAWNDTGKTLTLSGATIDCTGNDAVAGIVCAMQLLTNHDIVLAENSTNIVKAGASTNSISRGIFFEDLEESATIPSIGGSGTLKVTGGAARGVGSGSFGIVCDVTETLAFIDDATVIASSAVAQLGAGIAGLIDIQSGKITANGIGIIHGYGIQSTGMTMSGGNVTATGRATGTASGTETTYSCGISVNGGVGMTGGKLSASGATAAISTEGGTITANGEAVTVTGEKEEFTSGTTDTLTQIDDEIPVVISFTPSVTFDARNGVDIPDAVITGGKIALPANLTWEEGYIFEGWYTDIDGTGVEVTADTTFAESDTVYAKWIATNGKTVCTEALDFTTVNKDIGNASEGWAWNNTSKTLTLSGATIDCSGHDAAAGIVYGIRLSNDHDIFLAKNSTNIVKAGDSADSISIGIDYNENAANPLISGKGTLDVTGGAVGNEGFGSFGIVCSENETLTFKDATIVASSSAEAERGGGIAGLIDIQSGTITATGTGTIYGYGIQSTGMTMSGGDVTATGKGTELGYGIAGRGDFDLEGGTLTLSGTTAAMATELGTINANGAEVTVTGENEAFESGTTETLTQADEETPVVISFDPKDEYAGANPLPPALISKTHVTVTLDTQTIEGETVEYGIRTIFGKIDWRDTPAFTGLTANTEYKFYARVKATETHKAGIKSDATIIETKTRPVYSDDESTTVTYVNTMNKPENGTASMSPDWPSKGQVITITTKPNAGYVVDSVIAKDASGKVIAVAEKGENSYTFSQPDSKVAVEVTYKKIGASGAHAFTDVAANDWFYAAVTKATANGWFSGTSDTIFSPLAPTSRGMAATILHRIEGQPKVNGSMFKDVTADAYYANGIAWAAEKSITRGYDNGNYGPNDNITREQLATILYRYAGYKGYDLSKRAALDGFIDSNSVSDYAKEAMSWAVGNGIISGRENNTLAPTQIANRAEVAAILVRFAELFAK